jgi:DNA-binding transcriptional regulator YiaG
MPGHPYVSKLADGRYFTVELPEGSADLDPVTGELILQPPAIRLLDRLRVLHSPLPPSTTAGRLRLLREVLDLTPDEMASQLQVPPSQIMEWESGIAKPSAEQLAALDRLRNRVVRSGHTLPRLAAAS